MKKTALTVATIVFGLIVLLVFGVQFIQLVKANGYIVHEYFDEPPVITVESPLNNDLFSSDTVVVSFTLTKPEYDWVNIYSGSSSKVESVVVTLNGTRYDRVAVSSELSVPFTYSLNLTDLKDGLHNVQLIAHCTGVHATYLHPGFVELDFSYPALSDIISFTVDTPEPTPSEEPGVQNASQFMVAGGAASLVSIIVFLGLLVYFIKRS